MTAYFPKMTLLQPGKNPLKTPKPTFFQIYQVKSPIKFQSFHPKFNLLFYRLFTKTQQLKIKTYFHWPLVKAVNYTKITRKIKCSPTASLHINYLESALKPNSHVIYTYFITGKVYVKKMYCDFQGYLCTLHLDTFGTGVSTCVLN